MSLWSIMVNVNQLGSLLFRNCIKRIPALVSITFLAVNSIIDYLPV